MSVECRAVCPVCLEPVLTVSAGGGPVWVDPEPCPAQGGPGNVLVRRTDGAAVVLGDWESDRTVVDQGVTIRHRLHRCHRHRFAYSEVVPAERLNVVLVEAGP